MMSTFLTVLETMERWKHGLPLAWNACGQTIVQWWAMVGSWHSRVDLADSLCCPGSYSYFQHCPARSMMRSDSFHGMSYLNLMEWAKFERRDESRWDRRGHQKLWKSWWPTSGLSCVQHSLPVKLAYNFWAWSGYTRISSDSDVSLLANIWAHV